MNKMKPAFKSYKSFMHPNVMSAISNVLFILFALALTIMSAAVGDNPGEDDYLISICACGLGMIFVTLLLALNAMKLNNRFFYSTPYAKTIITKLVPTIALVTSLFFTLIAVVSTAISLGTGHLTGNRLSDLFLVLSYSMPMVIFSSGFFSTPWLTFMLMWFPAAPFYFIIFSGEVPDTFMNKLSMNGFGLPLYASVIIFVAFVTLSYVLSQLIAKWSFSRRATKYMYNVVAMATYK